MNTENQIKFYRKKAKLTQKELGASIGVTDIYIHQLESGERENPSFKIVMKLCNVLNASHNDLMGAQGEDEYIPIDNTFGESIKNIRSEKHLSIRSLAKASNVNASYISRLERGIDAKPGLEVILKLSKALKIDVNELADIPFEVKKIDLSQISTKDLMDEIQRRLDK